MMMLPVNSAVSLAVNVMPLTSDTDFKTRLTSIAYNAAGMSLAWNFHTPAGVISQTAVTPASSGNYEWTHSGGGLYKIAVPASGGASIDNDTIGYGYFSGVCDGALPWVGPSYTFVPAAIVNALVSGSDYLPVNAEEIEGSDATTQLAAAALAALAQDASALESSAAAVSVVTFLMGVLFRSSTTDNPGYNTIYRSNGTVLAMIPIQTSSSGTPIVGVGEEP